MTYVNQLTKRKSIKTKENKKKIIPTKINVL